MDNMNNNPKKPTPGKAVACLVLGICSIAYSCASPVPVGMVCAIVDLILSDKLKKELFEVPKMGKIGRTLGIIGLVLSILGIVFWIVYIIVLVMFGEWEVSYY